MVRSGWEPVTAPNGRRADGRVPAPLPFGVRPGPVRRGSARGGLVQGGHPGGPLPAAVAAVTGAVLVLVSGFLPWFAAPDGALGLRRSGWAGGPAATVGLILATGLAVATFAHMIFGRPRFGWPGSGDLLADAPAAARLVAAAAGGAVLCILLAWLMPPRVSDPVLRASLDTVAAPGLFVGLAGALAQLAAVVLLLRRPRG